MIDDHAGVVAVGHAGEGNTVRLRARDRLAHRELAGREGQATAGVDLHRGATLARDARQRGAIDAAVLQMRGVLRHARQAVRADALRLGEHERARGGLRPSLRLHPRAASARCTSARSSADRDLHRKASSTLSAIRKLTRSLLSAERPAMCGVSSRFGQSLKCSDAGKRLGAEHVDRRTAERAALQRCRQRHLIDDAAARGVDQHRALLHRRDAARVEQVARRVDQRHMQADHIGAGDHFVEAGEAHAARGKRRVVGVHHRVEGDHVHADALRELRGQLADRAEADQAQGLAADLAAVGQRIARPLAGSHGGVLW